MRADFNALCWMLIGLAIGLAASGNLFAPGVILIAAALAWFHSKGWIQ